MIDARLRRNSALMAWINLLISPKRTRQGISTVLLDKGFQFLMNLNGLALALNIEGNPANLALTLYSLDAQPSSFR